MYKQILKNIKKRKKNEVLYRISHKKLRRKKMYRRIKRFPISEDTTLNKK